MEVRVATYGWIKNSKEEILFLHRHPDDSFGNKWDIPGGRMEPGEQPRESVQREVWEEAGLTLTPQRLLTAVANPDPNGKKWPIFLLYAFTYDGDPNNVKVDESHTEFRWMTRAQAKKELDMASALIALIHQLEKEHLV